MPDINLSGILSTFLGAAQSDGSVTKGLISQPEQTVEKATGLSLGGINLKSLIPVAIGILVAYAMSTGQAKTEKAAEKKVDEGKLDFADMKVGELLGGLDLSKLMGLGTAATATATAAAAPEPEPEPAAASSGITDLIAEQLKQSVMESITSQLLGGSTTKKSTKKSSDSGIVGDLIGGVVGSLLSKK